MEGGGNDRAGETHNAPSPSHFYKTMRYEWCVCVRACVCTTLKLFIKGLFSLFLLGVFRFISLLPSLVPHLLC